MFTLDLLRGLAELLAHSSLNLPLDDMSQPNAAGQTTDRRKQDVSRMTDQVR